MRDESGARHADVVEAQALQLARVAHRVVRPEPALGPVVRADARTERALLRPGFPHRGGDLERKLASVDPISIFSLIRKRRQELVQEIAVRRMQLEHVEADAPGAQSGADEILHEKLYFMDFKLTRERPALADRDRRRRDDLARARRSRCAGRAERSRRNSPREALFHGLQAHAGEASPRRPGSAKARPSATATAPR